MAAEDIGALVVRIEADLRNFERATDQINNRVNTMGSGLKKFAGVVAGAFAVGAVVNFGKQLITTASDAAEMQSKFNTVFENLASDAESWSKSFRNSVGGSRIQIKGMLADSQDMLTGFGATTDQAFDLSTKIQSLGTDLASFQNVQGGASEAVDRLRKGLLGEHENLKLLGIVINETVLAQELASRGDRRKLQDLSELEKIELRYAVAISQSKNAIGDAAKTSGGYANQIRNLQGILTDMSQTLGNTLLPLATEAVKKLNEKLEELMKPQRINDAGKLIDGLSPLEKTANDIKVAIDKVNDAFDWIKTHGDEIIAILSGLIFQFTALKIINNATAAINAFTIATNASTFSWNALNFAIKRNLIIAVFSAIVAAGIYLWKNWDSIMAKAEKLWAKITEVWNNIKTKTSEVWNGIKTTLTNTWNDIVKSALKFGKEIVNGLIQGINSMFSAAKRAATNLAAGVKDGIKNFLGIRSPSTVMAELGVSTIEGLSKGMLSMRENLIATMKKLGASVVDSVKDLPSKLEDIGNDAAGNMLDAIRKKTVELGGQVADGVENLSFEIRSRIANMEYVAKETRERVKESLKHEIPLSEVKKLIEKSGGLSKSDLERISKIPGVGLAHGTNYFRGGMAIVGERGPELINMPRGSQVIPNKETEALLRQGNLVNIHIENMHVRNDQDINLIARQLHLLQQSRARASGVVYGT